LHVFLVEAFAVRQLVGVHVVGVVAHLEFDRVLLFVSDVQTLDDFLECFVRGFNQQILALGG